MISIGHFRIHKILNFSNIAPIMVRQVCNFYDASYAVAVFMFQPHLCEMTEADLKGNFEDVSLASQGTGEIVQGLRRPWKWDTFG